MAIGGMSGGALAGMQNLAGGRSLQYLGRSAGGSPIPGVTIMNTGGAPAPTPTPTSAPTGGGAGGATAVTGGSNIMDLYTAALQRLSTGGLSLEASLADIEEGKRQAIARGQQGLVSGGLSGTTMMGGVPIAAEKTAGRARLAARGEAEGKYLTTLASFAAFAQRAELAAADRQAAMERLQVSLGSQERLAATSGTVNWPQPRPTQEAYTYGASLSSIPSTESYSQQFPSIYGEAEEPVPSLMQ